MEILFDSDECANTHVAEAFDGLNDDFDVFALLVAGLEHREVAELGEHPAEFGLKDHEHRHCHKRREGSQKPMKHRQLGLEKAGYERHYKQH